MALPSFESQWKQDTRSKPRILVLEITDRTKRDREPIAWLFVERQETCRVDEQDGSIYEASIRLTYQRIERSQSYPTNAKGYFCGGYKRGGDRGPIVSLTSESVTEGAVFLSLPGLEGQRIGTYLMNEIVTWARQWPEARVEPIELSATQAYGENRARRNRFYEQFGIVFEYHDSERRSGVSKPMLAAELTPVGTWQSNIRERAVHECLGDALHDLTRLAGDLATRENVINDLTAHINRVEAQPLRWALQTFWRRSVALRTNVVVLAVLAFVLWAYVKNS